MSPCPPLRLLEWDGGGYEKCSSIFNVLVLVFLVQPNYFSMMEYAPESSSNGKYSEKQGFVIIKYHYLL
jgi:hypothetical protein